MVRLLIVELCQLFGEPQAIARQGALAREARALLLTWLRACEMAVRHLLLIEAAALIGALPRSRVSTQKHVRTRRPYLHDPDYPEAWRVPFRCCLERRRSHRHGGGAPRKRVAFDRYANYFIDPAAAERARAEYAAWLARMRAGAPAPAPAKGSPGAPKASRRGPGPRVYSAWPLAERAEAVLRAFNEPAPFARRLAYRLRRRPQLARRLTHIPDDIDRALDRDAVARLHDAVRVAFPALNSS